jgi:hypothetical protein
MMIKKVYRLGTLASAALLLFSGCSDQFLRDKTNYSLISPKEVYEDFEAAKARVNFLYGILMPAYGYNTNNPGTADAGIFWNSYGASDAWSTATEEYGGVNEGNNFIVYPASIITYTASKGDYFHVSSKHMTPYGRIRECNNIIESVLASEFTEEEKDELLGQAYFWRAWCYYMIVKTLGGVPIIDHVQDPIIGDGTKESLIVQRSSTRECVEFICNDLQRAYNLLPDEWIEQSVDYGRVTRATAMAVMGRVRLLYASPLFNRKDDKSRWELAYEVNKMAAGLSSYTFPNPGTNASEWARMFAPQELVHNEAVMFSLYSVNETNGRYNGWEESIRPRNIFSNGKGREVTAEMIDLFPMADGKLSEQLSAKYPKLAAALGRSSLRYNENLFFMDRDPRFYRTFAFPGVRWTANADFNSERNPEAIVANYPYEGRNYELWSYAWYTKVENRDDPNSTDEMWIADGIKNAANDPAITVFLRKRSDDYDIAKSSMYDFTAVETSSGGQSVAAKRYTRSYAPYMEIRYGEVLLNYAESACGAGHGDEALEALREVRRRVGYTGDCGLPASLAGDRAALFSAILYERQIELAYEGKRYDDMRRWMLWDGGANFQFMNVPDTWIPSGWGGNTCEYLGVAPLNGTVRRRIVVYSKTGLGPAQTNKMKIETALNENGDSISRQVLTYNDPIMKAANEENLESAKRPAALDLMKDPVSNTGAMAALAQFYVNNLGVKRADNWDRERIGSTNIYISRPVGFHPEYYLWGLIGPGYSNNTYLSQTYGWPLTPNNPVYFDPMAE